MIVSLCPCEEVKVNVKQPVKNKEKFELLAKVNLFMMDYTFMVFSLFTDPDKNEKREPSVVSENLIPGLYLKWKHAECVSSSTNKTNPVLVCHPLF
jgi:hypothetical protein